MEYTAFWTHPYHGIGSVAIRNAATAKEAAEFAFEEIKHDFLCDNELDELEVSMAMDDVAVDVWAGRHGVRPETPPACKLPCLSG